MSSPEFAGLQAISGTAVAKRCARLASPAKRQLLWFIQGLSVMQDGCTRLASELLRMFPKQVGTALMHQLGMGEGQHYTGLEADVVDAELNDNGDCRLDTLRRQLDRLEIDPVELPNSPWDDAAAAPPRDYGPSVPWQDLYERCMEVAKARLPDFLTELCINPDLQFPAPGESEGKGWNSEIAEVSYFQDIIGALFEYKRRYEEQVKRGFRLTAIGRKIWMELDYALKSKTMVVLEGLEGRGKTEAVQAWCKCHFGEARFISLVGTNTKTSHFTEIAKALGVGHSNAHKVSQMQAGVQTVLRTSGLMLVIDEAHYFFNQAPRMKTRPEMLDWIDTALCNPPSPLALITTPQFLLFMERAAGQVGWNYRQFKRRCKRYCRLAANNTPEDIEAVTRHLLPGAKSAIIKQVSGYAALSKRDLSAVSDIVREAKLLAEEEGAAEITFEHIARATGLLFESDKPWAEMERRLQNQKLGRKALRHLPDIGAEAAPEGAQDPPETRGRNISPRLAITGACFGPDARARGSDFNSGLTGR